MAFSIREKKRSERKVNFTYLILNIKLISNRRKGENAYREIFRDLYENKITQDVGRGKKAFLRTMFPAQVGKESYYYGKITRFTHLENDNWVNIITREETTFPLEDGLFPNRQETEYVFIPQKHRFALKLSSEFSINNARDFFVKALKLVVDPDEDYNVVIQQSKDIFSAIYNADKVEKLTISVSYTNSDNIEDSYGEWLDDQLRESNIKETTTTYEAAKGETINIETPLIKGGLELAVENGEVEASIRDQMGRHKKIVTKDHPEKNKSTAASEDQLKDVIFMEVMDRYNNTQNNDE